MSVAITRYTPSEQIELAKTMAHANLLPRQYQGNPANLVWAIQYAEALGVHPMAAVTGIHVIEGKPSASAQLIGGLVRRAGHKLRVTFDRQKFVAIAQVTRHDDPEFLFESVWSMERAKAAGLANKNVWKQYPDAMLKARAITEVARDACSEALFGVIYTPEELGLDVNIDADDATVPASGPKRIEVQVPPLTRNADAIDAEIVELAEMPRLTDPAHLEDATQPQRARIQILRKELGLNDEAYRSGLQKVAGVSSSKDLTKTSAGDVITALERAAARRAETPDYWDADTEEVAA